MARSPKVGFDYFPLVTKFDVEVDALVSVHGSQGLGVLVTIWQMCYSEGCACRWDEIREIHICGKLKIDSELFRNILELIFKLNLLSRKFYEKTGLLTGHGVIKTYIQMCISSKRTAIITEEIRVYPEFIGIIPDKFGISTTKERKVKEIKEKEIEKSPPSNFSHLNPSWATFWAKVQEINSRHPTPITESLFLQIEAKTQFNAYQTAAEIAPGGRWHDSNGSIVGDNWASKLEFKVKDWVKAWEKSKKNRTKAEIAQAETSEAVAGLLNSDGNYGEK